MFKKAIWCLIFCAHLTPSQLYAEPLIRVGAILPLSGPAANAGDTCRKGIEMHLNELGKTARIAVFFEDDQMVPKNTVLAYRKLKDVNNINIAFSVSANPGNALLPLTEQDGVVMISASSDNRLVERSQNGFLYWLSAKVTAQLWIDEALKRGIHSIHRLTDNQEGSLLSSRYFDQLNNGRIKIISDHTLEPSDSDMKSVLLKIKKSDGGDALLSNVGFSRHAIVAKQARAIGIKLPYIANTVIENKNELKNALGALEGAWYPQISDGNDSFNQKFEKLYPGTSLYAAAQCYDLVGILETASQHVSEGKTIKEGLKSILTFEGASGIMHVLEERIFSFDTVIKQVAGDKFIRIPGNLDTP